MKFKQKSDLFSKATLSEKIADALTVKPIADIEDDQVFGTKPRTVTRADFSSDSEDEAAISDFRKRNVNLLSDISKKYEGKIVSRKEHEQATESSGSEDSGDFNEKQTANNGQITDSESDNYENIKEKKSDIEDSDTDNNIQISKKLKDSADSGEDVSDDDYESDDDDYSISKYQKSKSQDSGEDNDGSDEEDGYDISQMEEPPKEEFEHVKKQNVSEEAKKGASVRNQLLIWEGLLEMRIHLQRCVNTANQMPLPDTFEELKVNKDYVDDVNATKTNISAVLDKFINLQNMLFMKYPETKCLLKSKESHELKTENKADSDEEIPSDTDNEEIPSDTDAEDTPVIGDTKPSKKNNIIVSKKRKLDDYEKEIATSHKSFKSFRDTTIQKWNDKTRLATATSIKNAPTNTILQQISYILSDREKLIKRTQLKRSEYDIVGYKRPEDVENTEENGEHNVIKNRKDVDEYIPEIFDDSDFYHQLLRELIECKSADISDPVQLSRQWIALQQMRSKMKRKVDTKATKGRKIKYVVHNQLVNYMAPEKCNTWTDEATNELYSSLFGKMFEHNNTSHNVDLQNVMLK
ncbi:protein AATF [Achroia grisella]|uniref:protein AATF n=1 Tax=Achroia grisella TaxID=688607 RepID=UPI0027D2E1B4|nr:protein AATF [Achroia grisella]